MTLDLVYKKKSLNLTTDKSLPNKTTYLILKNNVIDIKYKWI